VRAALVALALALAASARGDSPLGRLAEAVAAEVLRTAGGRPVELLVPEDRTGRSAALALDLQALVASRLEGKVTLTEQGPRLRVVSVLSESPGRLIFSARLLEEPSGRLRDLISLSTEADPSLLALSPMRTTAGSGRVDLIGSSRTPPLPSAVLDLAFLGEDRLVVLSADEVALFHWDQSGLSLLSRQPFSGPLDTVRRPGGILLAVEREGAFWALTSRAPRARLLAVEGGRLIGRHEAEALPWPGSRTGLRFRPGTNLLEGAVAGLGSGPFLELESAGAAVDGDGHLLLAAVDAPQELRVGPSLAGLWPGFLAASAPDPPSGRDSILVVDTQAGPAHVVATIPVEGTVRALASRMEGRVARLVVAVEEAAGTAHLLVLDLGPPLP